MEWAAISHPPTDGRSGPRSGDTGQEPEEIRMIGDFDGCSNALWTLYGNEAKSHDEARIQTLKDDMDGVLIFVRSYFNQDTIMNMVMLIRSPTGWSILCNPYLLYHRQQAGLEGQPDRPSGVLPPTKRRDPRSDISTSCVHRSSGPHPFHIATAFPCFQSFVI
jgi:hypothetical protein